MIKESPKRDVGFSVVGDNLELEIMISDKNLLYSNNQALVVCGVVNKGYSGYH